MSSNLPFRADTPTGCGLNANVDINSVIANSALPLSVPDLAAAERAE